MASIESKKECSMRVSWFASIVVRSLNYIDTRCRVSVGVESEQGDRGLLLSHWEEAARCACAF